MQRLGTPCRAAPVVQASALHDLVPTGRDQALPRPVPASPGAEAEFLVGNLGPVRIERWEGTGRAKSHGAVQNRPSAACYSILLQARGQSRLGHYGLDTMLGQGDLALVNNAAPHSILLDPQSDLFLLRVPLRLLRTYLPSPEQFCGRPLRVGDGICEGVGDLIASICTQLETGLAEDYRSRIARNLLDLLATAFALALDGALQGTPVICDRNARVRLHIEETLRDPELRPSIIAAHLRLSPRYLRAIFAASHETVSAYILRRRLEECARELADPALQHLSITDIAFGWGFNSGPHFARSFRVHFDMSPRDYRRLGLERARRDVI